MPQRMEFRHKRWPLTPPRPLSAPMRVTDTSDRAKIREELHQKERRRLEAFINNTPPLSNMDGPVHTHASEMVPPSQPPLSTPAAVAVSPPLESAMPLMQSSIPLPPPVHAQSSAMPSEQSSITDPHPVNVQPNLANQGTDRSLSKLISKLLRHEAKNLGVAVSEEGWIALTDVIGAINSPALRAIVFGGDPNALGLTTFGEQDVRRICSVDDKQRHVLRELPGGVVQLRAAQGHTMPGVRGRTSSSPSRPRRASRCTAPTGRHGTRLPSRRAASRGCLATTSTSRATCRAWAASSPGCGATRSSTCGSTSTPRWRGASASTSPPTASSSATGETATACCPLSTLRA